MHVTTLVYMRADIHVLGSNNIASFIHYFIFPQGQKHYDENEQYKHNCTVHVLQKS